MSNESDPLSLKAVLTLIDTTEYFRDHLLGRLDRKESYFPEANEDDLMQLVDQVEDTLDELEVHYNALRKQNSSLMPFAEMLRNKRNRS